MKYNKTLKATKYLLNWNLFFIRIHNEIAMKELKTRTKDHSSQNISLEKKSEKISQLIQLKWMKF